MTKQGELFDPKRFPRRDPAELREKFPNLNQGWGKETRPSKPDEWLIRLNSEEMLWAEHLGNVIYRKGLEQCEQTSFENQGLPEEDLNSCIQGYRNEIIVAKKFDLAFTSDWKDRHGGRPDFGPLDGPGIGVRSTNAPFYPQIRVKPHDCAICAYVLVCEFQPGVSRIHAWCWGFAAKLCTPLSNPRPIMRDGKVVLGAPAHFVPMTIDNQPNEIVNLFGTYPRAYMDLTKKVLSLCAKGYRPWMVK